MSKESIVSNKSTELFYDLVCRSFTASWEMFMEVNGDGDANDYLDDPGFMSLFNIYVIDHIRITLRDSQPKKETVAIFMKLTLNKSLPC